MQLFVGVQTARKQDTQNTNHAPLAVVVGVCKLIGVFPVLVSV